MDKRIVGLFLVVLLAACQGASAAEPVCPPPVAEDHFGFDECYTLFTFPPETPVPVAPAPVVVPRVTPPATDTE